MFDQFNSPRISLDTPAPMPTKRGNPNQPRDPSSGQFIKAKRVRVGSPPGARPTQ